MFELFVYYLKQLITFPTFANVRTIKLFLNQVFAYQAVRIENLLTRQNQLDFQSLVQIEPEDFSYFTKEDFQNIIGSDQINLYSPSRY